jgi:hypothetical protein
MAMTAPDKSFGVKDMKMTTGGTTGGNTGGMSGRTGSSRSYPKGGPTMKVLPDTDAAPFNPQKVAASTIYVGGVD